MLRYLIERHDVGIAVGTGNSSNTTTIDGDNIGEDDERQPKPLTCCDSSVQSQSDRGVHT
jgi:hypothetical protein